MKYEFLKFSISLLPETFHIARKIREALLPSAVLALCGRLGSGKTTFVKGFAYEQSKFIESPSFVLLKDYRLNQEVTLFHADLYRIETAEQIASTGIMECFNADRFYIAIEWPEPILLKLRQMPFTLLELYFEYDDSGSNFRELMIYSKDNKVLKAIKKLL